MEEEEEEESAESDLGMEELGVWRNWEIDAVNHPLVSRA